MTKLRIEAQFPGVTLTEMEPLLTLSNEPIEVRWENTKAERRILRTLKDREVTLVVANAAAMERAASILGLRMLVERKFAANGLEALNMPGGNWREFTTKNGASLSRGVLVASVAAGLRRGNDSKALRGVVIESLLDHTAPIDADVLVALRNQGVCNC